VHITVSAGVASWPADGATVGDLVATADRRLFEAKEAGRNRVVGGHEGEKARG
jgi:diguanylate cyclase (GGDEF)-like protein